MKIVFLILILSSFAHAARFNIEFKRSPSKDLLNSLKEKFNISRIERFSKSPAFSNFYIFESESDEILKLVDENIMTIQKNKSAEAFNHLYNDQWYLDAKGQSVYNDIDDIRSIQFNALKKYDIKYSENKQDKDLEKIIIAVVDHGVDVTHKDLKKNIYRNIKECSSFGSVRFNAIDDLDGNGFVGDCHGIDFSTDLENGNPNVKDENGHGTHVAGIIAAENNEIGITGVATNTLILPIKVFKKGKMSATVDRIAKGIVYAVDNGAKIINLSLGWPKSFENKLIHKAVKYAFDNNVLIVAAAGNNSNNARISPCNYQGVICVGATNAKGEIATFSNYGSNVDILAPGDFILSTIPKSITSRFYNLKGYDIKNGTSQAAPMVAGYLSVLKGKFPEASIDELYAHLYSTTINTEKDQKFSQFGIMQMDLSNLKANIFKPILKAKEYSKVVDRKFTIEFDVKSYSKLDDLISVSVISKTDGVSVNSSKTELKLQFSETGSLSFNAEISNLLQDNTFEFDIKLKAANFNKVIRSRVTLLNAAPQFMSKTVSKRINIKNVATVMDESKLFDTTDYYMLSKNDKNIKVHLLNDREKFEIKSTIDLGEIERLLSIVKTDNNYDGISDFKIKVIKEVNKKKIIRIYYLNHKFESLYKEFKYLDHSPEGALGRQFSFVKTKLGDSFFAKELFMAEGTIPANQYVQDPFLNNQNTKTSRIYENDLVSSEETYNLKTRLVSTKEFLDKVKSDYSELSRSLFIHHLIQSKEDFYNSINSIITVIDDFGQRELRKLVLKTESDFSVGKVINARLSRSTFFAQAISITDGFDKGGSLISLYAQNPTRIKIKDTLGTSLFYKGQNKRDSILGHIATYFDGEYQSFIQTKNTLTLINSDSIQTKNVTRFSFLPGAVLTDSFYPIAINIDNKLTPAIYVDGTSISNNFVNLIHSDGDKLISPIRSSIFIEKGCRAMNPVYSKEGNTFKYVILCQDRKLEYQL
jgi:hypothetical protein